MRFCLKINKPSQIFEHIFLPYKKKVNTISNFTSSAMPKINTYVLASGFTAFYVLYCISNENITNVCNWILNLLYLQGTIIFIVVTFSSIFLTFQFSSLKSQDSLISYYQYRYHLSKLLKFLNPFFKFLQSI